MNQMFIDQWRETAAAWDQRFQAVGDQGDAQSPCEGWCANDVVEHAVGVQAQIAGGILGIQAEGMEWPDLHQAMSSAMEDPSVLDGELPQGPFGPMSKAMMLGVGISDLLIHTWDLSRAIGADETLPAGPVTSAYMGLQRFPEEAMRASGRFSAAIEVADDADEQTKMLAFAGRQV